MSTGNRPCDARELLNTAAVRPSACEGSTSPSRLCQRHKLNLLLYNQQQLANAYCAMLAIKAVCRKKITERVHWSRRGSGDWGGKHRQQLPHPGKRQSPAIKGFFSTFWVSQNALSEKTRSSADADNGLDAFSGQSRPITMALFFWDIQCRKMSWRVVSCRQRSLKVIESCTIR